MLGRAPLHHAARSCNLTAINFILTKCQNTPMLAIIANQNTIGDETPLMKAAEQGSMEIIFMLLKAGSNPFLKNK
jgi:hypothetical protein